MGYDRFSFKQQQGLDKVLVSERLNGEDSHSRHSSDVAKPDR